MTDMSDVSSRTFADGQTWTPPLKGVQLSDVSLVFMIEKNDSAAYIENVVQR